MELVAKKMEKMERREDILICQWRSLCERIIEKAIQLPKLSVIFIVNKCTKTVKRLLLKCTKKTR